MNAAVIAAASKARVLVLWLGIASLLGLHLSIGQRVLAVLSIVLAVAVEVALDGHRIWPATRTRYHPAA